MISDSHSIENQILAALDTADYQTLFSALEPVSLFQGQVVYEADAPIEYVYFPQTAVFSMLATMEDGRTIEVGPVGREGLVGLRIFLGAETTPDRVLLHMAGSAMRLRANELRAELAIGKPVLPQKLLRYTQMLLAMTGRTSACNKLHSLDQQLARWLLTMSDYADHNLQLTHELIGLTLGVRRAGVTEAAGSFKDTGLIDYKRGSIKIIDRQGLQAVACECYEIIRDEYDRLAADLSETISS
jgi:CRP-like cAMP-binding protein